MARDAALPQCEQIGALKPAHRVPARSVRRLGERRLGRLDHVVVAFPALVLELDVLDRDRVRVRV